MAQVTITWKAFGNKPERNRFISSVTFTTEFNITDANRNQFLDVVYDQTNFYAGNLWNIIEPLLSPTRTHTALSIGDSITIDGSEYEVSESGFTLVEKVGA